MTNLEYIKSFVMGWLQDNIAYPSNNSSFRSTFYYTDKAIVLTEINSYMTIEQIIERVKKRIENSKECTINLRNTKFYDSHSHMFDSKNDLLIRDNKVIEDDVETLLELHDKICRVEVLFYPKYIESLTQVDTNN